jgi:hypothetical protein
MTFRNKARGHDNEARVGGNIGENSRKTLFLF